MKRALTAFVASMVLLPSVALAQFSDNKVKLGVLTDYGFTADITGEGMIVATKMAVNDFGGKVGNVPVEVISADHQGKADVALSIARKWIDVDGVDIIIGAPYSPISLAVSQLAREKNKVFLASAATTSRLTGDACSPNTVQVHVDSYALINIIARATKQLNGESWFMLVRDDAFGHDQDNVAREILGKIGGKVVDTVKHPVGTTDYSSYLLRARSSGAKTFVIGSTGDDLVNVLKQTSEFGMMKGNQLVVAAGASLTELLAVDRDITEGLLVVEPFYWNQNERTRKFSERFAQLYRKGGKPTLPSIYQAETYSGVIHILKALAELKSDSDGVAIVNQMKAMPTEDAALGSGSVRVDGRHIHALDLYKVKLAKDIKEPQALYEHVRSIPATEAWRSLEDGNCPLVKK